jgi:FixJ family two-component response regulator
MTSPERSILVVEDDPGMREALEKLLLAAGFGVTTFPSAEEFLRAGAAGRAACLIFDIRLPGMSGIDLYRRLNEYGIRRPVVFITAHGDAQVRAETEALGASAYLQKPFGGRQLLEAVEAAAGNGAAREAHPA